MPNETTNPGNVILTRPPIEMAEHGLQHAANRDFYRAMQEVIELLRAEALLRECHPIHDRLVELSDFIGAEHCQDYVAETGIA